MATGDIDEHTNCADLGIIAISDVVNGIAVRNQQVRVFVPVHVRQSKRIRAPSTGIVGNCSSKTSMLLRENCCDLENSFSGGKGVVSCLPVALNGHFGVTSPARSRTAC